MNFHSQRCIFFPIQSDRSLAYRFDLTFIIFREHLYHPHLTDRGVDPDTAASSWQNWDLKARSPALGPAFPPPELSLLCEARPFSELREANVGCLLLAGSSFQALGATAKEERVPEARRVDYTQSQSMLLLPSLIMEGGDGLQLGDGGDRL